MKVRTTTTITEIEADARELRESNTVAQNLMMLLNRCFQNHEPFDDDETEEAKEAEEKQCED